MLRFLSTSLMNSRMNRYTLLKIQQCAAIHARLRVLLSQQKRNNKKVTWSQTFKSLGNAKTTRGKFKSKKYPLHTPPLTSWFTGQLIFGYSQRSKLLLVSSVWLRFCLHSSDTCSSLVTSSRTSKGNSLWTGLFTVIALPVLVMTLTTTALTLSSVPGINCSALPSLHWLRGRSSSNKVTTSLTEREILPSGLSLWRYRFRNSVTYSLLRLAAPQHHLRTHMLMVWSLTFPQLLQEGYASRHNQALRSSGSSANIVSHSVSFVQRIPPPGGSVDVKPPGNSSVGEKSLDTRVWKHLS